MDKPRKHDYPVGIPLRPPPGWRGQDVLHVVPVPMPPRAPARRSGQGPALKVALIGLMVIVCMAVGWFSVGGPRRSAAKRPRGKPGTPEALAQAAPREGKATPREEARPVVPAPPVAPPPQEKIDKPPPPKPMPKPAVPKEEPKPAGGPTLTYEQHILPIMQRSCIGCHGGRKKRGGLDLTSFASLKEGGDNGTGVVAGKPDDSPIYETIHAGRMPPSGKKLPPGDLRMIREWIEGGARGRRTR